MANGGGAVSYERGTPVINALAFLDLTDTAAMWAMVEQDIQGNLAHNKTPSLPLPPSDITPESQSGFLTTVASWRTSLIRNRPPPWTLQWDLLEPNGGPEFFFVMSEVPLLTCMLAGGGSNSVYRCTSRICIFLEETFIYEEETLTTP